MTPTARYHSRKMKTRIRHGYKSQGHRILNCRPMYYSSSSSPPLASSSADPLSLNSSTAPLSSSFSSLSRTTMISSSSAMVLRAEVDGEGTERRRSSRESLLMASSQCPVDVQGCLTVPKRLVLRFLRQTTRTICQRTVYERVPQARDRERQQPATRHNPRPRQTFRRGLSEPTSIS